MIIMSEYIEISSNLEVRAVICFLFVKEMAPIQIHRELIIVYSLDEMTRQQVRKWYKKFRD